MPAAAILSPHLDDAVLSAWWALRSTPDTVVVNVFDGAPAPGMLSRWDRITGSDDSSVRMQERHEEDRRALAIAERPSVSLGLLEVEYRETADARAELEEALAGATDGAEEVWAPAGIGAHPDHVAVRDWALDAAGRGRRVRLYAELPYCVRHGWPAWVTGTDPHPYLRPELWWERFMPADGALLAATAHALDPDEVRLKLAAIDEYRTQVFALDGGPTRVLRVPEVIAHEASWRAG
jgi:LmbE family N-acetylglucosaminyl deacetylase